LASLFPPWGSMGGVGASGVLGVLGGGGFLNWGALGLGGGGGGGWVWLLRGGARGRGAGCLGGGVARWGVGRRAGGRGPCVGVGGVVFFVVQSPLGKMAPPIATKDVATSHPPLPLIVASLFPSPRKCAEERPSPSPLVSLEKIYPLRLYFRAPLAPLFLLLVPCAECYRLSATQLTAPLC